MDNSKDSFESSDVFWTRSNRRFLSRMAWDEVAMNLHESYRFKTSPPLEFESAWVSWRLPNLEISGRLGLI